MFEELAVWLDAPDLVRETTYEGLAPRQVVLEIGYQGNLAALANRTVHIMVEQPEPLYLADSFVTPYDTGDAVSLRLHGNSAHALAAGRVAGTLKVHICLDPNCAVSVKNSPLSVGYEIDVRPGIAISANAIEQTVHYAAPPPERSLMVSVPAEADGWSISAFGPDVPGAHPGSFTMVSQWLRRSGNTLTFQPPADLLPGMYAQEFLITSTVPDPTLPTVRHRLTRTLRVSHTVLATGPYAVSPPSAEVTQSLGGLPVGSRVPHLVSQVGGSFTRLGVRTDAFPPEAAANPLLSNWLAFFSGPTIDLASHVIAYCDPVRTLCLPVGTYRGALLLRHTARDGVQTDFEVPVTLNLVP